MKRAIHGEKWLIDEMEAQGPSGIQNVGLPINANMLVGTWDLISSGRAYNDPTLWSVIPSPSGNTDTQVFNAPGTGHYTGYQLIPGNQVWNQTDTIVSDSDFTWNLQDSTLTLQLLF